MTMNLTENEILLRMKENLRKASELCDVMAISPERWSTFAQFKKSMDVVEDCCRQMNYWRQDTRWLPMGRHAALMVQNTRKYLINNPLTSVSNTAYHMLINLAEMIRAITAGVVKDLETKATGRAGMILPDYIALPTRTQGRPVQVCSTPGGVILPDRVAA